MSQGKIVSAGTNGIHNDATHQDIPLDHLVRFHNHAFEDYKGDQFDLLVESIEVNGLIHQIAVRPHPTEEGKFEILSGHNRVAVAKKLEWPTIPAVIRNMTDDEAVLFANEANVAQRRFENWKSSEKAKSIYQFHTGIAKQGKRTDRTSGEENQKFDARKETARVYRVSENTVRLYLDLYRLIEPLKKRLDSNNSNNKDNKGNKFGTTAAQALSFLPEVIQEIINTVLQEDSATCEITVANARKVRDKFKDYKAEDTDETTKVKSDIRGLLSKETDTLEFEKVPVVAIEMEATLYELLFPGQDPDEAVVKEIVEAIEGYREMKAEISVAAGIIKTSANNESIYKPIIKEDK